ncbi:MAG: hypothetical protein R3C44_11190 [Chloroflexota bacterium]
MHLAESDGNVSVWFALDNGQTQWARWDIAAATAERLVLSVTPDATAPQVPSTDSVLLEDGAWALEIRRDPFRITITHAGRYY